MSLLNEMTDRAAVARLPAVAYTCKQFSSYDRKSTSADDVATWFANGDAAKYLRVEENGSRREFVMMDADGPGAVVRIWSANPKGTLRIYLDGAAQPVVEAPMTDVLGGKWRVAAPLSAERSRGWNLYLPIPYARHCKITSDKGEFYYQINYRTFAVGASIRSFAAADLDALAAIIEGVQASLLKADAANAGEDAATLLKPQVDQRRLLPGESMRVVVDTSSKPAAISQLSVRIKADDQAQARRSTVMSMTCDGEQTIWAPVGGFFGADVGVVEYHDWYRTVKPDGTMTCRWIMPFRQSCEITLENLNQEAVDVEIAVDLIPWQWDDRSMHFRAAWKQEHEIATVGGNGTRDFNYVSVIGSGVYVGDSLAVMNPVPEWWGEGDEKIYVDGEKFPSHFGTGTEDYYGYAWCCPQPFVAPFHSQPRCDGDAYGNNWGHTTVSRVRSLDAIPFTRSLQFDMEIWHWRACTESYAVTTYFYARPGASINVQPTPLEAARLIPQPLPLPKPMKIEGAIECETLAGVVASPGVTVVPQGGFGPKLWSEDQQLWIQARKPGDSVEFSIPAPDAGLATITIYGTRSWDYGIVRFTVNGKPAGEDVDFYNTAGRDVAATGPIVLGVFEPVAGKFTIRAEVMGGNPKSEGTRSFFGLDCLTLTAP